jgi:uncharacterized protein YidB (DUF937 family)
MSHLGGSNSNVSENIISAALSKLMPTNSSDGLDIQGLLGQLNGGGSASMAASWLGDGSNSSVDSKQIIDLFGQSKVTSFAQDLGVDENTAIGGLSSMIPNLIDGSSKGGSLLDSIGGGDMIGSLAKGALGSFFK